MLDYTSKVVLAPMVRVSELPIRLLSLKYGADLVWGPEIVDRKLIQCKRVVNDSIGCIDFVENSLSSPIVPDKSLEYQKKVVFRTFPENERGKLVFQLGTACPKLAVQAAKVVANDVDAIDLNSGCPKHFSVHSGMGAGLLKTPDKLVSILKALVTEVGQPYNISISVKIRILDTVEETLALVKRLVKTGVSCLTVHCRTAVMRPREPVIRDSLSKIAQICHEAGIACFVNGDIKGRWQLQEMKDTYGVDGVMIARAAESNPSCFGASEDLISARKVALELTKTAIKYDTHPSGLKYCLLKVLVGKDPVYQKISRAKESTEHLKILEEAVKEEEASSGEAVKGGIKESVEDTVKAVSSEGSSSERTSGTTSAVSLEKHTERPQEDTENSRNEKGDDQLTDSSGTLKRSTVEGGFDSVLAPSKRSVTTSSTVC